LEFVLLFIAHGADGVGQIIAFTPLLALDQR